MHSCNHTSWCSYVERGSLPRKKENVQVGTLIVEVEKEVFFSETEKSVMQDKELVSQLS